MVVDVGGRWGRGKGFERESSFHCDALDSLPKQMLTAYATRPTPAPRRALDLAHRMALVLA